jgi:hypothetical protein
MGIVIPLEDIRDGSPLDLLARHPERARMLALASRDMLGLASRLAAPLVLPLGDRASRAWLARNANPYLDEIDTVAERVGVDGVHALNVCFEWGCTSGAVATSDGVMLFRVMDWMFPRLGDALVVARQSGPAGEFFAVTWPGVSGIFQGMAPGRFAVAINQAPMRLHGRGVVADWLRNRIETNRQQGLPPAHLLRQVFETAPDYATACERLGSTPLAVPAIFIVGGVRAGEGCVIERTETACMMRPLDGASICAANHFESSFEDHGSGWLPRSHDSHERLACAMATRDFKDDLAWFSAPIANDKTRLAMTANAATGSLELVGTDGARATTEMFRLPVG